jgi:hypothetical protein
MAESADIRPTLSPPTYFYKTHSPRATFLRLMTQVTLSYIGTADLRRPEYAFSFLFLALKNSLCSKKRNDETFACLSKSPRFQKVCARLGVRSVNTDRPISYRPKLSYRRQQASVLISVSAHLSRFWVSFEPVCEC